MENVNFNKLINEDNNFVVAEEKAYLILSQKCIGITKNSQDIDKFLQNCEYGDIVKIYIGNEEECYAIQHRILCADTIMACDGKIVGLPVRVNQPCLLNRVCDEKLMKIYEFIR